MKIGVSVCLANMNNSVKFVVGPFRVINRNASTDLPVGLMTLLRDQIPSYKK
jgi:hypothetical protein